MKRRSFLTRSSTALGGSWIAMSLPVILSTAGVACKAREEEHAFKILTATEATELEAIAAQIIPSDDSPGATETGVIYFMDAAIATRPDVIEPMRKGLAELLAAVYANHNNESFAGLESAQQIEVLKGIENTRFFGTVRFLTLAGMFSNPSYGGNRDEIGWKLIGFEAPHPSLPPFGYYDADYVAKGESSWET